MADPLGVGNGLIGGGGITYTYTDFELTAVVGDGFIDAPDINISLTAQTATLRSGGGIIGAGLPTLGFNDYSAELATGYGTIGTGSAQLRDIVRALFPALSPSDRSFEPPEYAVSKYKAMNGAKSRRLWASQPGGGTLDLVFENIDDDDAESILAAHDVAKGAANDVILPDAVLSGAEGDLLAYMRSPGGQAWSFDAPPELESVKEGMSTVRVKLSARRKVKFNSVGSVGGTFAVGAAPVDEIDPLSFDDCDFIGRAADDGPFSPLAYPFWRAVDATSGTSLTAWQSTTASKPFFFGSSAPLCPSPAGLSWYGGGTIYINPAFPTASVGGLLASLNIVDLSGGFIGSIRQWFGSLDIATPFAMSNPVAFEFSNDSVAVAEYWAGEPNPCE